MLRFKVIHLRLIFFLFLLGLFSSWAHNSAFAYDTDRVCNEDGQKVWYFAIGKDVFALPYDQFFDSTGGPLVDNVDSKLALVPPDSKASVGCKNNPQQLRHFAVFNRPELQPTSYLGVLPKSVDLLQMNRYPSGTDTNPGTDYMIESLVIAGTDCKSKKFIFRYADGTVLCTDKEGQLNPLLNKGAFYFSTRWEFIISGNLYLTPLGQNLVMGENTNSIDVTYLLTPNILVAYNWIPPMTATNIDANYLVAVDKLFQKKLLAYRVNNYKWYQ